MLRANKNLVIWKSTQLPSVRLLVEKQTVVWSDKKAYHPNKKS